MVKKYLKGGKSEGMSLSEVAKVHNMNAEQLRPQLQKGIKHELEHTDKITDARRIALDHLVEFPDYYDRLDKIEKMHLGGDMSKHLAPNGKPSNLTHEQWHLVRTPEFKNWFGDWENDPKNASKVVDDNGEPLVVSRGDNANAKKGFVFKTGFNRMGFINKDRLPNQYFHYFVNNYDVALGYGQNQIESHNEKVEETGKGKLWEAKVTPYFLNIRNLIDITPNNPSFPTFKEFENELKNEMGEEWFQHWKYQHPYNYGTRISNSYLNKLFEDKLGKDYLEDRYISKWQKEGFANNKTNKDSYEFFIEFKNRSSSSDILNKVVRSMLEKNVDGLVFLELTHWDGGFWGNYKKYESGELKYDYKRWIEKPKVFATLNSNQIKLADGTNTTFDGENLDIRYKRGGRTISQTPAPKSDRVVGSKTNPKGSASDSKLGKSIKFNDSLEKAIQNKVDAYNEKHSSDKVSLSTAKAIVRRGMGAYSTSHRPTISGGAPNSRQAWGLARLNKFLLKKAGVKVKSAYIQDDDLLKYANGGEVVAKNEDIRSNFNTMDKEVKHTMGKAGGYLVGRRHTEGGIKAMNKATGQPLEMEGGEVVITRNAVSDSKTREFEGQMLTNREILSKINESGGGVSFEDGGEVMVCGNQYNYGGTLMSDHDILHQMAVGGELDDMNEMEFEYGGDVSDFKLKNKIVFPINDVDSAYYVNIFEDPMDLQIFKVDVSVRGSGRPIFKGFTKWSKDEFVSKRSYQFYNRKDFLTLIEPQAQTYGVITPRPFTQIPKKSMLIPRMPNTRAMYDRFTSILDVGMQNVPSQYNTDAKTKFNWLLGNPTFQENIIEFFDEWAIQEPNFIYEEGVKKKVVRAKKEDKFQYGIESIKFGKSWEDELKPYNNKLVKNDGQNSLVNLLTKVIKEFYLTDLTNPNLKLYEDRTMEIPVKELSLIQKNGGVKMDYGITAVGLRNIEMRTTDPTRNKLLNKKSGYNIKLVIDNIEDLGGANIYYYLFDKMGYQYGSGESTWQQWFKNDNIDFNIKLSLDDYCRVVGYLLARYCYENDLPSIRPIYNISEEPLMIEDVKNVLEFDDTDLNVYQGSQFGAWLAICVLYYRANYVSQTSKAKTSADVRIAQSLKVGDKVEISEQEMNAIGFDGLDENGELLKGEVIGIRSVPAMMRPVNPEGKMYTIRYYVQDPNGTLKNDWEGKDLVLLEPSDVVQLEGEPTSTKKQPVGKNKKALGNLSELDKNIYDLQYLISMTSDFDFEVKLQLRQQLTEFQKLKDIMYASENSEQLMKTTSPNYDGKYAVAIIETMFNADSITLDERPNYSLPKADGFQPNGNETLLNQTNFNLIQTPMFKEWFGDYLNAYDFKGLSGYDNIIPVSKTLTDGYEPLVVYQGLGRVFERQRFDSFPTSYFAVNPNYAEWFATTKGQRTQTDGYVLPFFLNVRNPLDFTYFGIDKVAPKDFFDYLFVKTGQTPEQLGFDARFLQPNVPPMEIWAYIRNSPNAITAIAKQGIYDGFHFYENNPQASGNQYQTEVWTTFFSNQAKLASDQRSKMLYSANQGFLMAKGGLVKK
jgi:hypothetical protein